MTDMDPPPSLTEGGPSGHELDVEQYAWDRWPDLMKAGVPDRVSAAMWHARLHVDGVCRCVPKARP